MVQIPRFGDSLSLTGITIKHTEIENCGSAFDFTQNSIRALDASNVVIANSYMHNSGHMLQMRNDSNWIVENNYFKDGWSSASNHGEAVSLKETTLRCGITFLKILPESLGGPA